MAKRRKQDFAGGNADIAAARAIKPEVSVEFARYGLNPPLPDVPRREARATDRAPVAGQPLLNLAPQPLPADVISPA